MKNKPFSIRIDNPCTENWSSMTVNDAGKFCSHCQKNVIDFTNCSDDELISILEKLDGKICGRLQKNQLERIFVAAKNRKVSPHLNKILAGLFALGMIEASDLRAQQDHINIKTTWSPDTTQNAVDHSQANNPPANNSDKKVIHKEIVANIIHGKVIQPGDSLPVRANIGFDYSSINWQTDSLGNFSIAIPDSIKADSMKLVFSAPGYASVEKIVYRKNFQQPLVVEMNYEILMGEIEYIPPVKQKKRRNK